MGFLVQHHFWKILQRKLNLMEQEWQNLIIYVALLRIASFYTSFDLCLLVVSELPSCSNKLSLSIQQSFFFKCPLQYYLYFDQLAFVYIWSPSGMCLSVVPPKKWLILSDNFLCCMQARTKENHLLSFFFAQIRSACRCVMLLQRLEKANQNTG